MVVRILISIALLFTAAGRLRAETLSDSYTAVRTAQTTVTMLSDSTAVAPGKSFHLGFHFEMIPDWHVYWKNPGDSGLPPKVRWILPDGVSAGEFDWPIPERIPLGPLANYGYSKEVLFAVPITVGSELRPGQELSIEAEFSWLICKEDCIPQEGEFMLTLPIRERPEPEPPAQPLFQRFRKRLPQGGARKLRAAETDRRMLRIEIDAPGLTADQAARAYFFPETRALINPAAAQSATLVGDALVIEAPKADTFQTLPATIRGTVRIDATYGFDGATDADSDPPAPAARAAESSPALAALLISALLGGMILNLMPCVFPVLSIKILGLIEHARDNLRTRMEHGAAFALGVVLSFAALGGALLALRSAGSKIGWGFQMQSPLVVAALALLFFILGLMFLGSIELGAGLSQASGKLDRGTGRLGSFLSGLLAVLVAAPCTAPFMGAAIGAALTLGPLSTLAVFAALGVGMALPYFVLISFPQLLRLLPKPGDWMERMKQLMAFPLFATVIWLLWVLSLQSGGSAVAAVLCGCLLASFGIWIRRIAASRFLKTGGALLILASAAVLLMIDPDAAPAGPSDSAPYSDAYGLTWEPFSDALVERYVKEGRIVYLDFTAAWCLTCQVNKKITLSSSSLRDTFRAANVALIRGDWTHQDPAITELLKRYGRAGVPLNVVLGGASNVEPEVLPALLTGSIVETAIKARIDSSSDRKHRA